MPHIPKWMENRDGGRREMFPRAQEELFFLFPLFCEHVPDGSMVT